MKVREALLKIDANTMCVSGDLVSESINNVVIEGCDAINNTMGDVRVDFAKVNLVDSSALALILLWQRCSLANKQTTLKLVNLSPRLIDLARSCGLEEILSYK